MARKPTITLVSPAYNESQNLKPFYKAVCQAVLPLDRYNWEILLINDGSRDNTWEIITELTGSDPRVKGISLSRNFGKEIALTAGLESIEETDAMIFIDADLQHPPDLIPELVNHWEQGFQIVATQRDSLNTNWLRNLGSRLFYKIMNRFSEIRLEPNATDFRLIDREVLKVLKTFKERTRLFRGLVDWTGFKKVFIKFSAPERLEGKSTFNFNNLSGLAINSFTSYSLWPLRITGFLGLFVLATTCLSLLYMLVTQFVLGYEIYTRMAYFVVFNTFLFGIVLVALGMMAVYIGHIHTEVLLRPLYIVQEKAGFEND